MADPQVAGPESIALLSRVHPQLGLLLDTGTGGSTPSSVRVGDLYTSALRALHRHWQFLLVGVNVARALGRDVKLPRLTSKLIDMLGGEGYAEDKYEGREQAVLALGELRDPTAVDALVVLLSRDRGGRVAEVAEALAEIGDRRALVSLRNVAQEAWLSDWDRERVGRAITRLEGR